MTKGNQMKQKLIDALDMFAASMMLVIAIAGPVALHIYGVI
jgi:hypothetical protein